MRAQAFWLAFLRFWTLFFSVGTLACHIANVILINQYPSDVNIGSWWPKYVPYILYFVGPGVSTLSALALNVISLSGVQSIRGDRILCVLNTALMVVVIAYNTLNAGLVPWLGNAANKSIKATKGFATYCSVYQSDHLTFNRCWLSNGMWIGSIVIAAFWIILGIFVISHSGSDIYDEDDYDVYDFKDDVPMATAVSSVRKDDSASLPGQYHGNSPAVLSPSPNHANAGADYKDYYQQSGYPEYNSYYDYPPQSPYGGYNTPSGGGGYSVYAYGDGPAPVQGAYPIRQDDATHSGSEINGDRTYSPTHQQQQYYTHTTTAPHTPVVQTPNAY